MLRSTKDLIGYSVLAEDGKAGKVKDALFGDRHWRLRYLDVETRAGLHLNLHYVSDALNPEEAVTRRLVAAQYLGSPKVGLDRRAISASLTLEEVGRCPGFDEKLPVEEKYDREFRRFFRHAIYDERPILGGFGHASYVPPVSAYEHSDEELRHHLERMSEIAGEHMHSARAVMDYHARGQDENLGVVSDLILDTESWTFAYFVLDTRHGIPSKKYLVPMSEVAALDWSSSTLHVELSRETLTQERRYWPYDPVNHDENEHDYDYCGKPCLKNLMEELY